MLQTFWTITEKWVASSGCIVIGRSCQAVLAFQSHGHALLQDIRLWVAQDPAIDADLAGFNMLLLF